MGRKTQRGQSLVLLAVALTALLGFLALTVDVGRWYVARQKAVNVCDMAALGGAMELTNDPQTTERAMRAVLAVVDANAASNTLVRVDHTIGRNNPDIIVSYYNDTTDTNPALTENVRWTDSMGNPIPRPAPNRGLIVRGTVDVLPLFGRVLGDRAVRPIRAQTIVALGEASRIIAAMLPFGVSKDHIADLESYPSATIEHVLTYRTWTESWANAPGAFGTLGPGNTPGSTSASDLQFNIAWGYPNSFYVGQAIYTTTGNMTGALQSGLADRLDRSRYGTIDDWLAAFNSPDPQIHAQAMDDSRLVMFPIVDVATLTYNGSGSPESVRIAGFATYAISRWNPGTKQVFGYFVKSAWEGSIGVTGVNYGALAYHLL